MKYGESTFDILYLLFAVISGCIILRRAGNRACKLMGTAAVVLGAGDAFHLVPRVLNYFTDSGLTAALGVGKLITSVTMTVFYVLLYFIWAEYYRKQYHKSLTASVWALAAVRIILCLFPQNGWLENSSDMTWGIIRNIPFVILGGTICLLYFRQRQREAVFSTMWIYMLLSFIFYIPVAVAAGTVPMLGMLMLPKTVCYILMICAFLRASAMGRKNE